MTRWYRAYVGTVSDDKLAEVAVIANAPRSVAIAAWHAVLESTAADQGNGNFTTTPRRVAATLQERCETVEHVFAAFRELGMIEGNAVSAWKRRQFESDSSTERSRRHRESRRNPNATLQERRATPPDTDPEKEEERQEPFLPQLAKEANCSSSAKKADDAIGANLEKKNEERTSKRRGLNCNRSANSGISRQPNMVSNRLISSSRRATAKSRRWRGLANCAAIIRRPCRNFWSRSADPPFSLGRRVSGLISIG